MKRPFLSRALHIGVSFEMQSSSQERLAYSQYNYDTDRRAFKFNRKKTGERSEGGSEVIIPIIEPLQKILGELAAIQYNLLSVVKRFNAYETVLFQFVCLV